MSIMKFIRKFTTAEQEISQAYQGESLDELVHHPNPQVRAAVAEHNKDEHLDILAHDDNPEVIHHVLMALRDKDIDIALQSDNPTIRGMGAVATTDINKKVAIAHDPHYKARIVLAYPGSEVLNILCKDKDPRVRAAVASFHSEHLETLVNDPHVVVSSTAQHTHASPIKAQVGDLSHMRG